MLEYHHVAQASQVSTLKVGICRDGNPPYVVAPTAPGEDFKGFEVELWEGTYRKLGELLEKDAQEETAQNGSPSSLTSSLLSLAGKHRSPPPFIPYARDDLAPLLINGSVDVALCGLRVLSESNSDIEFDIPLKFTSPHLASSLVVVARKAEEQTNELTILSLAFGKPNAWAMFALLLLILLSVFFSHIFWLAERQDNINVHKAYGPGIFDSWWLAMVTALTVGYGDSVPVTIRGKLIMVIWMLFATYCLGLYGAAITMEQIFTSNDLHQSVDAAELSRNGTRIAVHTRHAYDNGYRESPSASILRVKDVGEQFRMLMDQEVEYVIEDRHTAQHYLSNSSVLMRSPWADARFGETLVMTSFSFKPHSIAFAVGQLNPLMAHPVFQSLNRAVVHHNYDLDFKKNTFPDQVRRWMPAIDAASRDTMFSTLVNMNQLIAGCVVAVILFWVTFVLLHNRKKLFQANVRAGLHRALGLGAKFSQTEVDKAARDLFARIDADGSGELSLTEMYDALKSYGSHVTEKKLRRMLLEETSARERAATDSHPSSSSGSGQGITRDKSSRHVISIDQRHFCALVRRLLVEDGETESRTELHGPILSKHLQMMSRDALGQLETTEERLVSAMTAVEQRMARHLGRSPSGHSTGGPHLRRSLGSKGPASAQDMAGRVSAKLTVQPVPVYDGEAEEGSRARTVDNGVLADVGGVQGLVAGESSPPLHEGASVDSLTQRVGSWDVHDI